MTGKCIRDSVAGGGSFPLENMVIVCVSLTCVCIVLSAAATVYWERFVGESWGGGEAADEVCRLFVDDPAWYRAYASLRSSNRGLDLLHACMRCVSSLKFWSI